MCIYLFGFLPMVPHPHLLLLLMAGMLGILLLLTAFMLLYLLRKKKRLRETREWRVQLGGLIQRAIYFDEEGKGEGDIPIPFRIARNLRRPAFRQLLTAELVSAKRSFSGSAGSNLVLLFNQLGLYKDSERKIKSRKWHIRARGIQELAAMEQRQLLARIYRLTNTHHELVRREAQSAIVQLYGFEGLRFLDIINSPLSEWQQMKLLHLLIRAQGVRTEKVRKWLVSANDSVRIFALKLVAELHLQDLHDEAAICLGHPADPVRMQAVRCLGDIYTDATARALINAYPAQTAVCQSVLLDVLAHIGTEEEIEFLTSQLNHEDDMLKLAAARALVRIGGKGLQRLEECPMLDIYPWKEIILHAKSEQTV